MNFSIFNQSINQSIDRSIDQELDRPDIFCLISWIYLVELELGFCFPQRFFNFRIQSGGGRSPRSFAKHQHRTSSDDDTP
jgi:hypothetical protein